MKVKGPAFLIMAVVALMFLAATLAGCASDESTSDDGTAYSRNSFYAGIPERTSHPRKAHVDFFDKVCTPSGPGEVSCHYTDE